MKKLAKVTIVIGVLVLSFRPAVVEAAIVRLDTSFNGVGYVTHNSAAGGNDRDYANYIVIQDDGKYVVSGTSRNSSGNDDLTIWRYNPGGSLDTSFNGVGYHTLHSIAGGNSHDMAASLQVQSDGKYVVTGSSVGSGSGWDMVLLRYNSDGSLDTTFNGTGYVVHHNAAGGNSNDFGVRIRIQSNGKYIVGGYSINASSNYDIALWRYNTDGSLDTTFDDDGYVTHDNAAGGSGADYLCSLGIQADGKFIVAGYSDNVSGNQDLAIWRYDTDGSLDTTFGGAGFVTLDNIAGGNDNDGGYSLKAQNDGKYIIVGRSVNSSANEDQIICRYNSNGLLDTTFNGNGCAVHNGAAGGNDGDRSEGVQILDNGKYVVSGRSENSSPNTDMAIWRYNTDGSLDTTFNGVGYITHGGAAGGEGFDDARYLQIDGEGRYILAGRSTNSLVDSPENWDMAIWRYENLYQIDSLSSDLDVTVSGSSIETGTSNGTYGLSTLQIESTNGIIAEVTADMTEDREWSDVVGDVDQEGLRSFIHNIHSAAGVIGNIALFVPYGDNHEGVGICPGVTSIEEVNSSCEGVEYYSEADANVSLVTVGGRVYWRVEGVSGSGGFSSEYLPDTGSNILGMMLFGFSMILLASIVAKLGLLKSSK